MSYGDSFIDLGAQFSNAPYDVACSSAGDIVYVIDTTSGELYKSVDGGVVFSFIVSISDASARSVACSSDGLIVYVLGLTGDDLYKSTDGGANFVLQWSAEQFVNINSVACSADGSIVHIPDTTYNKINTSTDGGLTFTKTGSVIVGDASSVACSSDGAIIYVTGNNQSIVVKSTDSGATFSTVADITGENLIGVTCSDDGAIVYATSGISKSIYRSSNSGLAFTDLGAQFSDGPLGISCSSDGDVVYVVDNFSDSIYRSGEPNIPPPPTSCLHPEAKEDINTGNLLASEAKADIVTGALLTPIALPPSSDFPLNYARIGYDNTLVNGSASATSDTVGSAKMLTPSTYDKWRPTVDSVATLVGTSQACDYVGIAAHNLGSDGVTLTVKVSNGGAYTTVYSQLVTTDKALFIRFAEGTYSDVELTLSGSTAPEIGVVFLGLELEMMRPIFTGHKPAPLSATDVMTPQVSDGGQFLGKQIVRRGYATSADFQHLTDEWYRDKFQPFVEHAKTRPYFWAWNLLESPDDIVYAWTNSNISPSYMGIRNWFEVSFEIEAHA